MKKSAVILRGIVALLVIAFEAAAVSVAPVEWDKIESWENMSLHFESGHPKSGAGSKQAEPGVDQNVIFLGLVAVFAAGSFGMGWRRIRSGRQREEFSLEKVANPQKRNQQG